MGKGTGGKKVSRTGKGTNLASDNLEYPRLRVDEDGSTAMIVQDDGTRFGTNSDDLIMSTIEQLGLVTGRGESPAESKVRRQSFNGALASIIDTKPKDSIELMLATQMASVHNMALELSRRAMHQEQSMEGAHLNINSANKLMRTYTAQVEALNKYRNKGKQQITVKHQNVNVNDGGQAVIGDVNQGEGNE